MRNRHHRAWRDVPAGLLDRVFPERQLYYRHGGRVRFVALGKSAQAVLALVLVASFGWVTFASVHLLFQDRVIESKNRRIADLESAHGQLSRELSDTRSHFVALTGDIEARHERLLDLLLRKQTLEKRLSALTDERDTAVGERNRALAAKRALEARVERLKTDLDATSARNSSLSEALGETRRSLSRAIGDRDRARRRYDSAEKHAGELERRLSALKSSQQVLVDRLRDRTLAGVREMTSVIELTGLDAGELLHPTDAGEPGRGGPLAILDPAGSANEFAGMGDEFENSVLELESHLVLREGLRRILRTLPLTPPVDHYRLASGFGKRRDPITGRWAMHSGLDLSGPFKSVVRATAAGVVTYAGRKGPYGRIVEIDHGRGISTRYAHLHQNLVKRGEEVEFRQPIGRMGTTGRSTGSHVHYEVLFKGQPQDPAKFLEAGRHVFKN